MAITLKQAFALNGSTDLTSFNDLQEQCKNTDYFTDSNPINKLSSWEGYWYGTGDYKISLSASTTSVAASGGSVTITYTIKQVTSTGDIVLSGVKPTITSSLGTAGTPTATNASGQGTCTITLSSLGCTVKSETTITVTGLYNGASSSTTFKQAANNKTTVAWNNPTISTFSYGNIAACSTSATPSISYSQTGTQSYTSGTCTTTVTINSGATISYSETTAHSAASVNSTSGVVTWSTNGKNSSSRSVGITATVTMNGKSVTKATTSIQNADTYTESGGVTSTTYGSWGGGAISFNNTADLSAAADSRTVTIQPWSRTKTVSTTAKIRTWVCGGTETLVAASSNNSTEYYTGTVAVSENGSYTSLSATSYTASSSAKTLTLTKSTCGSTPTSATTVTITADPTTSGPSTTTASISQQANQKDYNQTVLSLYHVIETTNLPAEADYTRVYMEGEVQKCYTSGAGCSTTTQTWAVDNVTSNVSWITFNSTDGTIRWDENTSPSSRSATLTIKYGSYSRNVNVTQEAGSSSAMLYIETAYYYSSTPGDWTVKFKYGSTTYSTVTASHAEYSSSGTQIIGVVVPDIVLNDTSTKSYTVVVEFGTGYESWSGTLSYSNRNKLRDGYSVTINAF